MAKDKINIKPLKPTGKENKDMNLSTPMVVKKKSPNKKSKPSNRKLDGEKFLDKPKHKVAKNAKMPSKKRLDGENFLGGKYIKTFNQVNLAPGLQGKEMTVGSIKESSSLEIKNNIEKIISNSPLGQMPFAGKRHLNHPDNIQTKKELESLTDDLYNYIMSLIGGKEK